jgi:hypothetical protein
VRGRGGGPDQGVGLVREVTKKHRALVAPPKREKDKKIWRQDGGMEHNTRETLPERSQRDYWKFITKYSSK